MRRSLLDYSVPLMLARARSLTLLYCFQKGIELSISFIVGIHTYAGEAAHMGGGVTKDSYHPQLVQPSCFDPY